MDKLGDHSRDNPRINPGLPGAIWLLGICAFFLVERWVVFNQAALVARLSPELSAMISAFSHFFGY